MQDWKNGSHFVQVFNGILVELSSEFVDNDMKFPQVLDQLRYFPPSYQGSPDRYHHQHMHPIYGNHKYLATGGATLCQRHAFNLVGGWNENFISFGFEDQEFCERIRKLDSELERIDGYNAYHMEHPRLNDSVYNNYYRSNESEYLRVLEMDAATLQDYANKGFRSIEFTH